MKNFILIALVSSFIGFAPTPLAAQNAAQSGQSSSQGLMADTFIQSAQGVLNRLDRGEVEAIYQSSSVVLQNATTLEQFRAAMNGRTQQLTNAVRRDWASIARSNIGQSSPSIAPGFYVTTTFQVVGRPGTPTLREVVTFRADEDRVWRLAGVAIEAL